MEMLAYIGDGHMRLELDGATMETYNKAKLSLSSRFLKVTGW
jgi:hypothetical protein